MSSKVWFRSLIQMKIGKVDQNNYLNTHVDHVFKSLVQIVAHFLDFQLLGEQIFFDLIQERNFDDHDNSNEYDHHNFGDDHHNQLDDDDDDHIDQQTHLVNPDIEPLNVHLSILSPVGVDGISQR